MNTIADMRIQKQEVEAKILDLIKQFESGTGAAVRYCLLEQAFDHKSENVVGVRLEVAL